MDSPTDRDTRAPWLRSFAARLGALSLVGLTAVVDAGPSVLRFGKGRDIRERLFRVPLPSLPERDDPSRTNHEAAAQPAHMTTILVTRTLGTGGVEVVVATLARLLPSHGVRVVVLCERGGATADALRNAGVDIIEAGDLASARARMTALPDHAVAQLHNAPDHLIEACRERHYPIVPVIHTMDINLTAADWEIEAQRAEEASVTIAVSESVQAFYLSHLPRAKMVTVRVVPNGVEVTDVPTEVSIEDRLELGRILDTNLNSAIVFACLARYELQKNIPGLVASFLAAAEIRTDIHLVVAGPVEDWLEHRLADLLRRSHTAGDRVHLMGVSSSRRLLACVDAFVMDSFFEGGPLALTEALVAGLPAIVADVGVAIEQVGTDGERGFVVPNAAMPRDEANITAIRRARRRPSKQRNKSQLVDAVLTVSDDIETWRERRTERAAQAQGQLSYRAMAMTHAEILTAINRDHGQFNL